MQYKTVALLILITVDFAIAGTPPSEKVGVSGKASSPKKPSSGSANAAYWRSSPLVWPSVRPAHSSSLGGLSFTIRGTVEDSTIWTGGVWTEAQETLSVFTCGLLSRQAIVRPSRGVPVETRSYDYDESGKLIRERMLAHLEGTAVGTFSWDRVTDYLYNDSSRVSQILFATTSPSGSQWVSRGRTTFFYQDLTVLQSVLTEYYDSGSWLPSDRSINYNNAEGLADSIIDESWVNGVWQRTDKTEYVRPSADSLIVIKPFHGQRWVYVYDLQLGLLRHAAQYWDIPDGWQPGVESSYSYDPDRILRNSFSTYFENGNAVRWEKYESVRNPAASVFLLFPKPGEQYFSTDTIDIRYFGSSESPVSLAYTTDNGALWTTFAAGLPDTGVSVYHWVPASGLGSVKVKAMQGPASDEMDGILTVFPGLEFLTQATTNIQCGVFSTGFIGVDPRGFSPNNLHSYPGFRYKGLPNSLFSAGVIVGQAGGQMSGMIGSFGTRTFAPEFPFAGPGSDAAFDQRTECRIIEQAPYYPVEITQKTASRMRDDFIIVDYSVKNLMSSTLSDFYIGVFADWDIGNFQANLGGVDGDRGLAYQYDPGLKDPNYYGLVALSGMSAASVTEAEPNMAFLVAPQAGSGGTPGDLRTFIGSGPFTIPAGGSQSVAFAISAGTSLVDLQAHADSVHVLWKKTVTTGVARADQQLPTCFSLSQNYPNPFNPSTTIRYELPKASRVSLKVYDVLGQEVSTLVDEEKPAGTYEVHFSTQNLSSGMYVYRLQVGDYVAAKKLILLR